jgi:hypothetical protein
VALSQILEILEAQAPAKQNLVLEDWLHVQINLLRLGYSTTRSSSTETGAESTSTAETPTAQTEPLTQDRMRLAKSVSAVRLNALARALNAVVTATVTLLHAAPLIPYKSLRFLLAEILEQEWETLRLALGPVA